MEFLSFYRRKLGIALALCTVQLLALNGCSVLTGVQPRTESAKVNGYLSTRSFFWKPGQVIPVCFVSPTDANAQSRFYFEQTIRESFNSFLSVQFEGFKKCETPSENPNSEKPEGSVGVHVLISDLGETARPAALGTGMGIEKFITSIVTEEQLKIS